MLISIMITIVVYIQFHEIFYAKDHQSDNRKTYYSCHCILNMSSVFVRDIDSSKTELHFHCQCQLTNPSLLMSQKINARMATATT